MKQATLPSGRLLLAICLAGLGLLLFGYLFYQTANKPSSHPIERPDGFKFSDHQRVDDQPTFTVDGELNNTQAVDWENIELVVSIYADEAYMTYCRGHIDSMTGNSQHNFRLVCRETAGSNLPDNIRYDLVVARAVRR